MFQNFVTLAENGDVVSNAIDGPDGVGKGTLSEIIADILSKGGNIIQMEYPQYPTPWGITLTNLLKKNDKNLTIEERMAVYALNRLESVTTIIKAALNFEPPVYIIFDRFPTSNILTMAYYYAKGELKGKSAEEIRDYLNNNIEQITKLLELIFEIDKDFIRFLSLKQTKVAVPLIDPSVSLARITTDSTRQGADLYESEIVQVIAYELYQVAARIPGSNIIIVPQEGRDPDKIAADIMDAYGYKSNQGNSNTGIALKVELDNQPEIADEVRQAMEKIFERFPRLRDLPNEEF